MNTAFQPGVIPGPQHPPGRTPGSVEITEQQVREYEHTIQPHYANIVGKPAALDPFSLPNGGRTVPDFTAYVANNAVLNVKDFGAVGDGTTDDTTAIAACLTAAHAAFDAAPVSVLNRVSAAPSVVFPAGTYTLTGTLTVRRQIRVVGEGRTATVIKTTADAPAFEVEPTNLRVYSAVAFQGLTICGDATTGTKTNQHGIRIRTLSASADGTLEVLDCGIQGMGGHGIYAPENSNTLRVLNSHIQSNWLDGIHLSGTFNTNSRIAFNIIRENRRGIYFNGTFTPSYLYSGHIVFNLFEGNTNGTGQVGSATRPAVGIELLKTRQLYILGNYFEAHLNHVYADTCAYLHIRDNQFFGAAEVPGLFTGFGGPARRVTDVAIVNASSVGCSIENNIMGAPVKPTGTADADWNTAGFGATYAVFSLFEGTNHVIVQRTDEPPTILGGSGAVDVLTRWTPSGLELGGPQGTDRLLLFGSHGSITAGQYVGLSAQLTRSDTTMKSGLRFYRGTDGLSGSIRVVTTDTSGTPNERHKILDTGDIELTRAGMGLILTSPDGSRFRLSVSDAGAAVFTEL